MPSPDVYWLALRRVRGVGPRTCKLLIEKFGTPEKIFQLSPDAIAAAGVPRNTASSIAEFRDFEPLEKELCELPNIGARLVKWSDADYPSNLRQIADPPPFLFVRGPAQLTDSNCIAVVGARAASDIGRGRFRGRCERHSRNIRLLAWHNGRNRPRRDFRNCSRRSR